MTTATRYQPRAGAEASARTKPEPFDQGLAFIARRLRLSVLDLDEHERNLLDDFARGASVDGEIRYRMITLRALLAIASRSTRLEDREALPELFRAEILTGHHGTMPLRDSFDVEASVTGPTNEAQRHFELNPNRSTWQVCRDALSRQLAATRHALDAVLGWRAS